jgi:Flp pilus assembly protein CpaB
MLTARTLVLAAGMFLVACGSGANRALPTLSIPPGMRAVTITVKQNAVPGDHVDLLGMDKGQEVIVLQNVEVVTREDNAVQFVVSPEDAKRVEQAVKRGQEPFRLRRN